MEELREAQKAALDTQCACGKQLGDFTTVNLTVLHAGDATRTQYNVIPTVAEAGFDCRIPATVDLAAFRAQLDAWAAADGVTYELVAGTGDRAEEHSFSSIGSDSAWWHVFTSACAAADVPLGEPSVFPAASDSRWVRLMLGVPCFGFSPMRRTPILLHEHDEYLSVAAFMEGIDVYERLLPHLADAVVPS